MTAFPQIVVGFMMVVFTSMKHLTQSRTSQKENLRENPRRKAKMSMLEATFLL